MARLVLAILALSACFATGEDDAYDLAGDPKASNAVKMVLNMMQDLDAKVVAEGEKEEKTYGKFSTWCSDTTKEKAEDIKDGEAKKNRLQSTIKKAEGERDELKDSSAKLTKDISELKAKIVDADAAREKAAAEYKKSNDENEHAVRATGQAADAIKASDDVSSFLQMDEHVETIRESALLAESAGFSSEESLDALSSTETDSTDSKDWKAPIIEMLEKLQGEFRSKDQKADVEEQKAITAYKLLRQQRLQTIATKEGSLAQTVDDTAARVKKISDSKEDLETTKSTIADDTKYLAETKQMCFEKEATFKQRKATRSEELEALRLATKTMRDVTAGNFTQSKSSLLEVAVRAVADPTILASAEAEAEATEETNGMLNSPFAFFQRIMHRHRYDVRVHSHHQHRHRLRRTQQEDPSAMSAIQTASNLPSLSREQQALLQFLNEKAASTKSSRLVRLARRVATGADPFAEVKELIRGLITKLRAEAKQSQTKKMSCDKKISESTVRRDAAAKKVEAINGDMEESTARKNRLTEDIALLKDEKRKMTLEKNKTTELRNEENTENKKSISEAQTGLSGVRQAKQILLDFYSKAKKKEVAKVNASAPTKVKSLVSVEPAPDAGFKNYEANKGSQAASSGIVGMLETIESDFERTIEDTQAEEATAVKDHAKFLAEMEESNAAKTQAEKIKTSQLGAVTKELSDADTELKGQITALKVAVQELKAHDEECGHGASYEERKAARKREMDALQEAIEFFESQ